MPSKNQYRIGQSEPYPISRSKIDDYVKCPRCFVLDRREWIKPPSGPMFTLNSAVDGLLKKEFDVHRANQTVHPAVAELGFGFIPADRPEMDDWRNNRKGVRVLHEPSNLEVFGAIDDLWCNPEDGSLLVVDYKTTARDTPLTEMGTADYQDAYRRQLEVYQWLLRKVGVEVSDTAYWLYATARKNADAFDAKLVFDFTLIEHTGSAGWVEGTLTAMKRDLEQPELVAARESCEMCTYVQVRGQHL